MMFWQRSKTPFHGGVERFLESQVRFMIIVRTGKSFAHRPPPEEGETPKRWLAICLVFISNTSDNRREGLFIEGRIPPVVRYHEPGDFLIHGLARLVKSNEADVAPVSSDR